MTWTTFFANSKVLGSRLKRPLLFVITSGLFFAQAPAFAESQPVTPASFPIYVSSIPDLNAYTIFANSGWDGNWYVGYDTCWIKKLPPVPKGQYSRAFIGAKVGRMKLDRSTMRAADPQSVAGSLYMGLSSTSAWKQDQSFLLVETSEIPQEGDAEVPITGAGESQWFWTEVPVSLVNQGGNNFVALWSPSSSLVNVASSPVVAAAWGDRLQDAWLKQNGKGEPPRTPTDLGAALSFFEPALALKLIPAGAEHPLAVQAVAWRESVTPRSNPVVIATVMGESIQSVWLEYMPEKSKGTWKKIGHTLRQAPYYLAVDKTKVPAGRVKLRVVASNIWEQKALSDSITIEISTPKKK